MRPERQQHNPERRSPTRLVEVGKLESRRVGDRHSSESVSELLILPDGRILVHNLTQPFAELLKQLNPTDEQIAVRTRLDTQHATRNTLPHEFPH